MQAGPYDYNPDTPHVPPDTCPWDAGRTSLIVGVAASPEAARRNHRDRAPAATRERIGAAPTTPLRRGFFLCGRWRKSTEEPGFTARRSCIYIAGSPKPQGSGPGTSRRISVPETIDSLLKAVFASERHLVPRWRSPFAVSLLAVFEKAA